MQYVGIQIRDPNVMFLLHIKHTPFPFLGFYFTFIAELLRDGR